MRDSDLIAKIREIKAERRYTLYDLSKLLDIQISTIGRWLKTGHINKVYAERVRERLNL